MIIDTVTMKNVSAFACSAFPHSGMVSTGMVVVLLIFVQLMVFLQCTLRNLLFCYADSLVLSFNLRLNHSGNVCTTLYYV